MQRLNYENQIANLESKMREMQKIINQLNNDLKNEREEKIEMLN